MSCYRIVLALISFLLLVANPGLTEAEIRVRFDQDEYQVDGPNVAIPIKILLDADADTRAIDQLESGLSSFGLRIGFDSTRASFNGLGDISAVPELDFDQFDLVKVQIAAKYLTGRPATWGEGDWNSAGGSPGNPPRGDGLFNPIDIVAALQAGVYLTGTYAAIQPSGRRGDSRTSLIYDATTGELSVDAPAGVELTSTNVDSASGIFSGDPAQNLGGSFDHDADTNIFKATFGGSFGSLSFGNVTQPGLEEAFLLGDLTVVGSLAGGGDLGEVDLVYVPVPEPASILLLSLDILALAGTWPFAPRTSANLTAHANERTTSGRALDKRPSIRRT